MIFDQEHAGDGPALSETNTAITIPIVFPHWSPTPIEEHFVEAWRPGVTRRIHQCRVLTFDGQMAGAAERVAPFGIRSALHSILNKTGPRWLVLHAPD
jgi:hypothetical protein